MLVYIILSWSLLQPKKVVYAYGIAAALLSTERWIMALFIGATQSVASYMPCKNNMSYFESTWLDGNFPPHIYLELLLP